ncbi:SH3 domain-containing protein [Oscillospiraceae bacterium 50-60]
MKKALIYALALALAVSLTACGQPKTEQPTDPAPSTSAPEPIATPEPIKDTTPEPEPEQTPAAPVETEDTQPPEETEAQEVESQVEQVQLFTDCNETVYATGTVNIRASYTADSEKLGSLNKGDSVTRTGIAIAGTEAEGWSRIQLSDGSIVYVSNKYLSTSKPSTGGGNTQNKPSGGQQQTQPSGGGQQDPQGPTPGYNPWENDDSNVVIDTRTEEQKQADIKKTQEASEGLTGTIQAGGLGN